MAASWGGRTTRLTVVRSADDARQRAADTKRRRTQQALIEAARKLADQPGVKMEDIATEAGVSNATAYSYYSSKGELLAAAENALQRRITAVRALYFSRYIRPTHGERASYDSLTKQFVATELHIIRTYQGELTRGNSVSARLVDWVIGSLVVDMKDVLNVGLEQGLLRPDLDLDAESRFYVAGILHYALACPKDDLKVLKEPFMGGSTRPDYDGAGWRLVNLFYRRIMTGLGATADSSWLQPTFEAPR